MTDNRLSEQHTAHTPGPWHLFPSNKLCIEAKSGNVALCNLARESYADARLIAAAPDLLEALRIMVQDCDSSVEVHCVHGGDAIETARAAIAKATGAK